ncbi:MAG: tRNA (guanosine(37)-N1)-methyltransferase TrmD, partial [Smithellaceae bacterium]|nr:tRNA (guanosine(37)-N1)-methyltransferase TrmD [Smithellaceae bacterium]
SRLIPNVLGNSESARDDSFSTELLEYPHYTMPAEYKGWRVPEVLLSGNHKDINYWRRIESLRRTFARRPDLIDKAGLTPEDEDIVDALKESVE